MQKHIDNRVVNAFDNHATEHQELDNFIASSSSTHFANICGYNSAYIGIRLLGRDINFEEIVKGMHVAYHQTPSILNISTMLATLGVKNRIRRFDGTYEAPDSTVAILCVSTIHNKLGHALVIRPIATGYQIVDSPSEPRLVSNIAMEYKDAIAIYLFPDRANFWEMQDRLEICTLLLFVICSLCCIYIAFTKHLKRASE